MTRRTNTTLLLLLVLRACSAGFNGLTSCIEDAHGCCVSAGYFWCGSSGRCTHGYDACEDGLGAAMQCTYQSRSYGVTYDLQQLQIQTGQQDHVLHDALAHPGSNYTYIFNFCANVVTPARCVNTSGGAGEVMTLPSPAYQLHDTWGRDEGRVRSCYRLGASVADEGDNVRMGLFDKAMPSRGVFLRYQHGNSCDDAQTDTLSAKAAERCHELDSSNSGGPTEATYCTRAVQLNVLCHNTITALPTTAQVEQLKPCFFEIIINPAWLVEQLEPCFFEITINSVYGCPIECGTDADGRVCSDRGICSYDKGKGGAQCLCTAGYSGGACQHDAADSTGDADGSAWSWLAWTVPAVCAGGVVWGCLLFYRKHKQRWPMPGTGGKFRYGRVPLDEYQQGGGNGRPEALELNEIMSLPGDHSAGEAADAMFKL